MMEIVLMQQLRDWVTEKEKNGIKQHSRKWKKRITFGGSVIATIQGKNPYSNIYKMLSEKIGLSAFEQSIAPQWGNLFEDVIKRYVEFDKKCTILGEDLYIEGPGDGTSYSPDGLTVLNVVFDYGFDDEIKTINEHLIVLMEYKCPYSRIPSGNPPEYYIPQVKMGLDLLKLPRIGLFVEGVFRRCS